MTEQPSLLITGGSGLLGLNWGAQKRKEAKVTLALHNKQISLNNLDTALLDLSDPVGIQRLAEASQANMVIHTAGLTSIELCEQQPELAYQVNSQFTENVCKVCKAMEIPMIHISTDNLFDGETAMVAEDDPINPVNVYGKSKAEAEKRILDLYDNVLVVRTNFYGWGPQYRPSFSDSIIAKLRQHTSMSLFSDVYYTPIYIPRLIEVTHEIVEKAGRGVFHIVGDERISKLSFGLAIAEKYGLSPDYISGGKLSEMTHLVRRPFDMSLSNVKARSFLGKDIGAVRSQLDRLYSDESSDHVREIQQLD